MNRNLIKFLMISIVGLTGLTFFTPTKVSAAATPWCYVLSPSYDGNCLNGQTKTALTNLSGLSGNNLKTKFISDMASFGQAQQQAGVTYIEGLIGNTNMSWDTRIMQSDVTLTIESYSYTINSAYDPGTNKVVTFPENLTASSLVFRTAVDNQIYLVIKLDCGNPVGVSPNIRNVPALPLIDGYKVSNDQAGNLYGPVSIDSIMATWPNAQGIYHSKSDSGQPFSIITTAPGGVTMTAADAISGYKLIGWSYFYCHFGVCNPPTSITGTTNPVFFGTKYDYEYHMTWSYAVIQPSTITGYKVDTAGNPIGPFSGDSISATNISAGGTVASTSDPYSLSVPPGSVNVTASNSVKDWVLVGYTPPCSSTNTGCINSPSNVALTTPNPTVNITTSSGLTYYVNWVYKPKQSGPPSDCPPFTDPIVNVALPDNSPSSGAPTGPSLTPNTTYNQYTRLGTTKVTGVFDISTGGNRVIPTLVSPALNVVQSQNQATLDYTPYVKAYPYDLNQPTVNYTDYYTVTPYVSASTPSGYTCSSGTGPDANHKCTITTYSGGVHTTTGTPITTYCTQGGTWNGQNCGTFTITTLTGYTYSCPYNGASLSGSGSTSVCIYSTSYPSVDHWTCNNSSGATWANGKTCLSVNRIHHPTCPYGGTLVSTTCYAYYSYTPTATAVYGPVSYPYASPASVTTYSCTPPYTGGGSSSVCTYSDATTTTTLIDATPYYNYTAQPSYQASINSTAQGTVMPACFDRGFSVTSVNSASANVSFNDPGNENPTSSTPSGYSATIKFSYTARKPEQGLRQIMKANLKYSYKFYKNSNPNSATICAATNGFTALGNSNLSVGDGATTPDPFIIPSTPCSVSVGAAANQLAPGDTICAIYTVSPTGSMVDIQGNVIASNGGIISSSEKCSSPIVNKPYSKVFGGDVSVGGSFATGLSCGSSVAGAGIFGWNTATNPVYGGHPNTGAGTQFATSNLSSSNLFASNQYNPNSGLPQSPLGLSFANVGATGNNFGVSLGSANCIPDYFSSKPAGAAPISSGSLSGNNGTYYSAGDLTINPSDIGIGNHITIYVAGNTYVKGNINFNSNYTSINDIQSLVIINKGGNIYIDKSVQSLNGIFIAQPTSASSADGYIYDCASGFSAIANNQLYDNCGTQLTVNGSFIANKVFLNRTGNATNNKLSSSLRASYATETNTATNATEIFNYGPAFWMNLSLPQSTATGSTSAGYDSIISLPPIL